MKARYVKPAITIVGMESEGFICDSSNGLNAAWGNKSGDWHNEGNNEDQSTSTGIEDDNGIISSQSKKYGPGSWDRW